MVMTGKVSFSQTIIDLTLFLSVCFLFALCIFSMQMIFDHKVEINKISELW